MSNPRNPGCPSHPSPSELISTILSVFLDFVSFPIFPKLLKYCHMFSATHYWLSTDWQTPLHKNDTFARHHQCLNCCSINGKFSYYLRINISFNKLIIPIFLETFWLTWLWEQHLYWLFLKFAGYCYSTLLIPYLLYPLKREELQDLYLQLFFSHIHSLVTTVKFLYSTQTSSLNYLLNTSICMSNRYLEFNM